MVIDSQRRQDQVSVDYNRHILFNSVILNASNWVSCIMPYDALLHQIKMMCRILTPVMTTRCFYTSCQVFGAKVSAVEMKKFSSGEALQDSYVEKEWGNHKGEGISLFQICGSAVTGTMLQSSWRMWSKVLGEN